MDEERETLIADFDRLHRGDSLDRAGFLTLLTWGLIVPVVALLIGWVWLA